MKRLGILITSSNDIENVWQLVQAAHARGVKLHLHLTGDGVKATQDPVFQRLCDTAEVTICRQSSVQKGLHDELTKRWADLLTEPDHITKMVDCCDRCMIL